MSCSGHSVRISVQFCTLYNGFVSFRLLCRLCFMLRQLLPVLGCIVLCFALVACGGCKRAAVKPRDESATFEAYADLPGLQATHYAPLQAEYALLVAERATPRLLDEDATKAVNASGADLQHVLNENFNTSAVEYAMSRTDRILQGGELRWDAVTLMQSSQFAQQYERQRQQVRQALSDSNVHLVMPLSRGVGLDIEFLEAQNSQLVCRIGFYMW